MTLKQAKAKSVKKSLEIMGGRKINGYLDKQKKNKLLDEIYADFKAELEDAKAQGFREAVKEMDKVKG